MIDSALPDSLVDLPADPDDFRGHAGDVDHDLYSDLFGSPFEEVTAAKGKSSRARVT
jgi:hypothetical protein